MKNMLTKVLTMSVIAGVLLSGVNMAQAYDVDETTGFGEGFSITISPDAPVVKPAVQVAAKKVVKPVVKKVAKKPAIVKISTVKSK